MRIKYAICGICGKWSRVGFRCHWCGAFRFILHGKTNYVNDKGILMGRALPMPSNMEFVLDRLILRCEQQWKKENPTKPETMRPNWRVLAALKKAGASAETIKKVLSTIPPSKPRPKNYARDSWK